MAAEEYVPVTGDDWYQRRRQDAEGEFFRKVADQGPHKGAGGATRQGIYCFTASGKLLAFKNAQDPDVMREALRHGLAEWKKLPAREREPGAVNVDDLGKLDKNYTRTPPAGGLIVTVYTRILDQDGKGNYVKGSCAFKGGDRAARDHLWLTKSEWQGLVPAQAKKGDEFAVPAPLARRIARYHLVDNTRGEPPFWKAEQVRKLEMRLTVEEATAKTVSLRLAGAVLLADDADTAKAKRGFDAQLFGTIVYDAEKKALERFDVVAVGDHWGEGPFTGGARPGKKPLGVAFELAAGETAADRVPPQGARDFDDYWGK